MLWTTMILLAAGLAATSAPTAAQETASRPDMREVHAILLGLAIDGETPLPDGAADIYTSVLDDPAAPRLVTRLEVAIDPCRSRTIAALQFPGQWAGLTLALADLRRITGVAAYASVDDMIRKRNPLRYDDPRAAQVVLTGDGLYCGSRIPLANDEGASRTTCGDRIDLSMIDEEQRARGRAALAAAGRTCRITALQPG
ncbi:hypothetical protein KYK29_12395 [Shinella daejeonensis]|uniref:hypothetical protein n=1 Tax=Shinella daejeonensis TaxID=659017 RepID=UPI0020C7E2F0|nr:hypothetical protein [Shinella daejeonensis]MCP8895722.1 hypothetical protein [Shinella daejeonensis]